MYYDIVGIIEVKNVSDGKTSGLKNVYRRWFYRWIIKKYLSDCDSFIDVGCGKGLFLDCLPEKAWKAGIDLEVQPIRHQQFVGNYLTADIPPVDCLFASQFIEHVNAEEFVKWADKYCGKKIVIITPRPTRTFWDDPTHIRPYTKKAIRTLLEQNDWRVLLSANLYPTASHITVAEKTK